MLKVLFVNGPPGAGKDILGKIAERTISGVRIVKFSSVLKERTHALYGITHMNGQPYAHNAFDAVKDGPCAEFMGLTPRQAYIAVSETYFKPQHGQRIFGELLKRELLDQCGPQNALLVVTDSGFQPEAEVLVEHFGAAQCALIRVARPGHTYYGDSRGPVDLAHLGVPCIDLPECSTLVQLEQEAVAAFRKLGLLESEHEEPAFDPGDLLPRDGAGVRLPSDR